MYSLAFLRNNFIFSYSTSGKVGRTCAISYSVLLVLAVKICYNVRTLQERGLLRMIQINELIREGVTKRIYATSDPDKAVVFFKDEAMAYHGLKRGRILGKGRSRTMKSAKPFSVCFRNIIYPTISLSSWMHGRA